MEQVRRPRHLMDPDNPRPQPRNDHSLTRVQQWVMSVLGVTTVLHLAGGLVVVVVFMDESKQGSRIGLLVIAGIFGLMGVAAGFAIHKRSPLTPWLLLGLIPALVGAWLAFGR